GLAHKFRPSESFMGDIDGTQDQLGSVERWTLAVVCTILATLVAAWIGVSVLDSMEDHAPRRRVTLPDTPSTDRVAVAFTEEMASTVRHCSVHVFWNGTVNGIDLKSREVVYLSGPHARVRQEIQGIQQRAQNYARMIGIEECPIIEHVPL
ncbi:MAG TPA: hypothetical protein VEX37_14625, partial [Thermomicrobiales bacterium]|nr:hypothetical protein [Thermomicrobiales bacterium]